MQEEHTHHYYFFGKAFESNIERVVYTGINSLISKILIQYSNFDTLDNATNVIKRC